jgi:hypothetical protein
MLYLVLSKLRYRPSAQQEAASVLDTGCALVGYEWMR